MLRIKLLKSPVAQNPRNRATVEALGLRKIGQTVEKEDNSSIRGMVHAIHHMLLVEGPDGTVLYDGRTVREHATRKSKKPPERH